MATPQDDYLKDTSQFDVARKRVQQQSATNLQSKRDALQRRFAQLGNLDSGARLKIEQQAEQEEAVNAQNANESIDAAQQAEMGRRREILQQQQFAAGEAEKNRGFSAEQNAMMRKLQEEQFGQSLEEQRAGRLQQNEQFGLGLGEQRAGRLQQNEQFGLGLGEQQAARAQQASQYEQSNLLATKQAKDAWDLGIKALEQQMREMEASLQSAEDANRSGDIGAKIKKAVASWNPF